VTPAPAVPAPVATEQPTVTPAEQASANSSWESRGRPHRMVTIHADRIDVVSEGGITQQVAVNAGNLTVQELDRVLPGDWLTIADGTAVLGATVVLTQGAVLEVGGVQTLQLAGGADAADAASLHTGGGRLVLTGVTVTSVDRGTGQPVVAPAAGRPSIIVSSGGRLDSTDTTISDLGTTPTATDTGRPGVVFNPGSTGSLVRTSVLRNATGLQLSRSDGVHLEDLTVRESIGDGLVLSGDTATTMSGIHAEHNTGNGVLVNGESSGRTITGIATTGNGEYGVAVVEQTGTQITGLTTSADTNGGLQLARSTNIVVTDVTATDQRAGVSTSPFSSGIVLDGVHTSGGRRGVLIDKSSHGVEIKNSTIHGAEIDGVSVAAQQVVLNDVQINDSGTAVKIERGAGDVQLNRLAVQGGQDGVVASTGTTGLVVTDLAAQGVESDAIRTASPDTRVIGGQITGGATGIDAAAATTITNTSITHAQTGIHSRSPDAVQAIGVTVNALDVGVSANSGSPFVLTNSSVHALQSVRGEVTYQGTNDLSLPPLNVISAIGIPLVLIAVALEGLHAIRQKRVGIGRIRRRPPMVPMTAT
jgi:Right handed beta helix region